MPVKAEMVAGDGEIGGDGKFFLEAGAEEGAVVADAETEPAAAGERDAIANPANQGQFSVRIFGSGMGWSGRHVLRIGQTADKDESEKSERKAGWLEVGWVEAQLWRSVGI
jgi:hypothetical protein